MVQTIEKAGKMVTPKKIRKMYRQAVEQSLEEGLAKESRKRIRRYRIILTCVIIYALAVTYAAIIGGYMLAKKAGL